MNTYTLKEYFKAKEAENSGVTQADLNDAMKSMMDLVFSVAMENDIKPKMLVKLLRDQKAISEYALKVVEFSKEPAINGAVKPKKTKVKKK